jgi:crotonobetainyl-CoA:carnitine CoA-transferase CaiB-like acyl-CoA transferase
VVTLPFDGFCVADLTRFVSGSYCTAVLASLGADVVKVEPLEGDPYRRQGTGWQGGESALFMALNAGKRSIALDLRATDGRIALERLVASADFFVENARPGAMARLGLDWESLHRRHPRVVAGSISGYGDIGPEATKGGFDLTVQAESGIMSVTGAQSSGPVKVGVPLLDVGAGMCCALGLVAAHVERMKTGAGQYVATSLLEFALAGLSTLAAGYFATGEVPGLLGTHSPVFAPYGAFRTADGWLTMAGAGTEDLWQRACAAIGAVHLSDDERFSDNARRVAHRDELSAELELVLGAHPTAYWVTRLEAAGVPTGAVRSLDEALANGQVGALGMVQHLEHERAGEISVVGPPIRLGGQVLSYRSAAPVLGAHTSELLLELGYAEPEIDEMDAMGVIRRA